MTRTMTDQQIMRAVAEIVEQSEQRLMAVLATKVSKEDLDGFATKFATKDDLKQFATRDDLKQFATKDDLKGFATKDDFERLETRLETLETRLSRKIAGSHTVNIQHHLETRRAIGELNRQFASMREGLAHAADFLAPPNTL